MPQTKTHRPRIYLAGPEVFMPNATDIAARKCALASEHGFIGAFPVDTDLPDASLTKHAQAQRISAANEKLMRSCAALIANLTPFRGVSVDAGTAFEVGFMQALGRPVAGYTTTPHPYVDRCRTFRQTNQRYDFDGDRPDYAIEDFGGAENLMITGAIESHGLRISITPATEACFDDLTGFKACLRQLQDLFNR